MKKIAFILLGIAMVFHSNAQSQKIIIRAGGAHNPNILYKYDDFTRTEKILYQSKNSRIGIINAHVSPNMKYISLIEIVEGTYNRNKSVSSYDKPPRNTLVILNHNGTIVMRLDEDVREYVWSPDGNEVAYITGTYSEGGEPANFSTTGFYILNIQTKGKIIIDHSSRPYTLHWLKTKEENCVYIKTRVREREKRILRYNIGKKRLEIAQVKGIHFSPDGKYYLQYPTMEDYNSRVFETATNKEITNQLPISIPPETWMPINWVYNQGHLFISHIIGRAPNGLIKSEYFVYDIETKKLIQTFTGKIIISNGYEYQTLTYNDYIVVDKTGGQAPKAEYIIQKIPKEYINSNEK